MRKNTFLLRKRIIKTAAGGNIRRPKKGSLARVFFIYFSSFFFRFRCTHDVRTGAEGKNLILSAYDDDERRHAPAA